MDQRSRSIAGSNTHARNDTNHLQEQLQTLQNRTLHDLDAFRTKKMNESTPFFRTTRV